jgi:hypothetical protein
MRINICGEVHRITGRTSGPNVTAFRLSAPLKKVLRCFGALNWGTSIVSDCREEILSCRGLMSQSSSPSAPLELFGCLRCAKYGIVQMSGDLYQANDRSASSRKKRTLSRWIHPVKKDDPQCPRSRGIECMFQGRVYEAAQEERDNRQSPLRPGRPSGG